MKQVVVAFVGRLFLTAEMVECRTMRKLVSAVAFQDLLTVGHPPLSRVLTFPCELFRSKLDRLFDAFAFFFPTGGFSDGLRLPRRRTAMSTANIFMISSAVGSFIPFAPMICSSLLDHVQHDGLIVQCQWVHCRDVDDFPPIIQILILRGLIRESGRHYYVKDS